LRVTRIRGAVAGREIAALRTLRTAGIRASLFGSATLTHSRLSTLRSAGSTGFDAASLTTLHAGAALRADTAFPALCKRDI
jgi:hypothetical protein